MLERRAGGGTAVRISAGRSRNALRADCQPNPAGSGFSSIVGPMRRSSERGPQARVSSSKNSDTEARLVIRSPRIGLDKKHSEELRPVMFANAEDVQADPIGVFNLFQ